MYGNSANHGGHEIWYADCDCPGTELHAYYMLSTTSYSKTQYNYIFHYVHRLYEYLGFDRESRSFNDISSFYEEYTDYCDYLDSCENETWMSNCHLECNGTSGGEYRFYCRAFCTAIPLTYERAVHTCNRCDACNKECEIYNQNDYSTLQSLQSCTVSDTSLTNRHFGKSWAHGKCYQYDPVIDTDFITMSNNTVVYFSESRESIGVFNSLGQTHYYCTLCYDGCDLMNLQVPNFYVV